MHPRVDRTYYKALERPMLHASGMNRTESDPVYKPKRAWVLIELNYHIFLHLINIAMTSQRRLRLALIGLGRLGAIRARILVSQQPRIEFVAACDTKPGAGEWAAENLPPSVKFFADPEECMRHSGAEAVLISTATATHAPLICLGLDLGLVRG